jgi:hypothetical protein
MVMVSQETTHRLRRHAGLVGTDEEMQPAPSVSGCLGSKDVSSECLEVAIADLLDVIALLNLELNGATPSQSTQVVQGIPRDVAYAVAEIINLLRQHAGSDAVETKVSLTDAAWVVETGWLAVLAGDIDDLRTHLADERAMRRDS